MSLVREGGLITKDEIATRGVTCLGSKLWKPENKKREPGNDSQTRIDEEKKESAVAVPTTSIVRNMLSSLEMKNVNLGSAKIAWCKPTMAVLPKKPKVLPGPHLP